MALPNGYHDDADDDVDGEIDFQEIEDRYAPALEFPLSSALLLDGAPIVGNDRKAKLLSVLKKLFDSRGFPVQDLEMPMQGDNSSGIVFVILKDPASATAAAAALDGHPFDKRHTLGLRTFDEVERLQEEVDAEWQDPPAPEYTERVRSLA